MHFGVVDRTLPGFSVNYNQLTIRGLQQVVFHALGAI